MGRWEPNARGRLEQAALELYAERGYEQTPVAEITRRAGLTERTFFRHFADKREVLFAGSGRLAELCAGAVAAAPAAATPMDAAVAALYAAADVFEERGDLVRLRQSVIDANAELQERELTKLATLSGALAEALRDRGTDDLTARLTAEAAVAVLKVAFEHWIHGSGEQTLRHLLGECVDSLGTAVARGPGAAGSVSG
ncbi:MULTISPECIES: TetR/AcrR family transcriptional regulator [Streptomyces]|uniref:TetR/AcrR family transcriptional regulator n=1 Tax=Streptomyces TaxID=1883 RepID=UPI0006B053CC|nr:TetR/AcrR family transcriptional regulator [Streptomyces sp. NRRL F-7442]KOX46445.1 TetR family transcriptional regulator [Streptomyces sp. NRRL F-7442]NEB59452.1 TetR family transcriptional regulator [Streptomyces diastaticus]